MTHKNTEVESMKSLLDVELSHSRNYQDFKVQVANESAVITATDKRDGNRYVVDSVPLTNYRW